MGAAETDKQRVQEVKDLLAQSLKADATAHPNVSCHVDLAYIGGYHAVVVTEETLTFRFGIGPLLDVWGAEQRNRVVDPPGQYDDLGDGPPVVGTAPADVVSWIRTVIA